jgi:hypothetical protein
MLLRDHQRSVLAWLVLLVGVWIGPEAPAEEWKSEDGKIAVTVPDAPAFEKTPAKLGVLAMWVSQDKRITLGVVQTAWQAGLPLEPKSIGQGMAQGFHGELLSTEMTKQGEHPMQIATCRSRTLNGELFATQEVVTFGDRAYKIIATSVGVDTRTQPECQKFLASLKPLVAPERTRERGGQDAASRLGYMIGQILGVFIVVGGAAGIVIGISKLVSPKPKKKKKKKRIPRPIVEDE